MGRPLALAVHVPTEKTLLRLLQSLPPHWKAVKKSGHLVVSASYVFDAKPVTVASFSMEVHPTAREAESLRETESSVPTDPTRAYLTPPWPIDVVYSWVDGEDPAWQERRDAALQQATADATLAPSSHQNSVDDVRYVSSDELRYSLRSVYQFANWVRRIFIVTDGQTPTWLRTDDPRVTIIDHNEILPASTFNSHAIESALHRIPGLSEHYLYLNDDVFFGGPAYPSDYFDESGRAKFFPSKLTIPPGNADFTDKPIIAAAKNGRDVMAEHFGVQITNRLSHSVHAQRRSVIEEMERNLPDEFARLRSTPFRSPRDLSIAASLHHWYGYELGLTTPAETNYFYLNITERGARQALEALSDLRRYDVFCLNQEESDARSTTAQADLTRFLETYFPFPSPWEK